MTDAEWEIVVEASWLKATNELKAALKLFLAIRNAGLRWHRPIEWTAAVGQFAILFSDRV